MLESVNMFSDEARGRRQGGGGGGGDYNSDENDLSMQIFDDRKITEWPYDFRFLIMVTIL